jgi:thioredoxin 1
MVNQFEDTELDEIKKKKIAEMLERAIEQKLSQNPSGKPITLTDANFSREVEKQKIIVVDFWAPWCGPCRMVGPIIEELSREYAGKVAFGKLNVDENPIVPNSFGIQGIPTLIIFKNGKSVEMIVGAAPKYQIEAKFRSHLN